MALIQGIHHVNLKCVTREDYDRVMAFYRDALGLRVVRTWAGGAMLDTGCGLLEIFRDGQNYPGQGALRHLALLTEDVDACAEAARAAGYPPFLGPDDRMIPSEPPFPLRMAFCIGPLGEEIEFFQVK